MTKRPLIAFYAPMEAASSGAASGVGRVASLLLQALDMAGYAVVAPDLPRCYDGKGDLNVQKAQKLACEAAGAGLLGSWASEGTRPAAWFTYHPYYKSPDWIGPEICRTLNIPYAVAEASHAPKRAEGPWALGHHGAASAIRAADLVFASTSVDAVCLKPLLKTGASLSTLKPFIDPELFLRARSQACLSQRTKVRALTVAMMRHPRKRESYRILAQAWKDIDPHTADLVIVGGGPMQEDIEADFQGSANAFFAGALPPPGVAEAMAQSDIFLWPGYGEAYGITYLEAQAAGLPVVAQRQRGVPDVAADGIGGILTDPGDAAAYSAAIRRLIADPLLRGRMSRTAQDYVRAQHTLTQASETLRSAITSRLRS